jgi:hypothetical protein
VPLDKHEARGLRSKAPADRPKARRPIPASGRFVAIDHNRPEVVESKARIDELSEAIRSSNDLFADRSQRLAVMSEIRELRDAVDQPIIRLAYLREATYKTIGWLAKEASSGLVKAAAAAAFVALLKWLGTF